MVLLGKIKVRLGYINCEIIALIFHIWPQDRCGIVKARGGEQMIIDARKFFAICADKGLTLKQVKQKSGISYGTLKAIQKGEKIRMATLGKLATMLNIKAIELLPEA